MWSLSKPQLDLQNETIIPISAPELRLVTGVSLLIIRTEHSPGSQLPQKHQKSNSNIYLNSFLDKIIYL